MVELCVHLGFKGKFLLISSKNTFPYTRNFLLLVDTQIQMEKKLSILSLFESAYQKQT